MLAGLVRDLFFVNWKIQANSLKFNGIQPSSYVKLFYSFVIVRFIAESTLTLMNETGEALSQPAITCSKLTIETLEQGVKYVQS